MVSSSAPPEVSMQRTFPSQLSGQWSLICEVKGWRAWDCSPLDLSPICPNTSDPFTRDVEGLEWISVFTAYISSTETAAACVQCAASLNYFSRHPRTLPAVSPCCNLSVTSPKNTPPPFSFPLSVVLGTLLSYRRSPCLQGSWLQRGVTRRRIILKSGCNPPT